MKNNTIKTDSYKNYVLETLKTTVTTYVKVNQVYVRVHDGQKAFVRTV